MEGANDEGMATPPPQKCWFQCCWQFKLPFVRGGRSGPSCTMILFYLCTKLFPSIHWGCIKMYWNLWAPSFLFLHLPLIPSRSHPTPPLCGLVMGGKWGVWGVVAEGANNFFQRCLLAPNAPNKHWPWFSGSLDKPPSLGRRHGNLCGWVPRPPAWCQHVFLCELQLKLL